MSIQWKQLDFKDTIHNRNGTIYCVSRNFARLNAIIKTCQNNLFAIELHVINVDITKLQS